MLARAGIASRRGSEELIRAGRVTVNGHIGLIGDRADPETDEICLDGQPVAPLLKFIYLALNKPCGYLSTRHDPQGRRTLMDLVPFKNVYPVGRLDKDTSGLILLTNDGEFAYLMAHPSHEVDKTYLARVEGKPAMTDLQRLRKGIILDDGITSPARVRIIQAGPNAALVEIVIHEGRKRQVRRMFEAVGHPVLELCRIAINGLKLGNLEPGKYRELAPSEIMELRKAVRK
ncbi:MAG: pseudouridine synthase [bacterium]|nr:pseudouridine synthase [bacterium]MDD4557481.1 pseudouridine synthase [bacterium]